MKVSAVTSLGCKMLNENDLRALGFRHVGHDVQISSRASIYGIPNITIGDNVRIDDFTVISASSPMTIGSYVHIATHCTIIGREELVLEDFSAVATGSRVLTATDDFSGAALIGPTIPEEYRNVFYGKITIGRYVIVGANCLLLPESNLMEGVAVGACSLVKGTLEPWGIYGGVPASLIKPRKKDLLQLEKKLLSGR